MATKQKQRTLL